MEEKELRFQFEKLQQQYQDLDELCTLTKEINDSYYNIIRRLHERESKLKNRVAELEQGYLDFYNTIQEGIKLAQDRRQLVCTGPHQFSTKTETVKEIRKYFIQIQMLDSVKDSFITGMKDMNIEVRK